MRPALLLCLLLLAACAARPLPYASVEPSEEPRPAVPAGITPLTVEQAQQSD